MDPTTISQLGSQWVYIINVLTLKEGAIPIYDHHEQFLDG